MKILIPLLLISISCHSQKKGDNTIVIKGNFPAEKIKSFLFNNGYILKNSDISFFTTEPKLSGVSDIKLQIFRTDTATLIRGQLATLDTYSQIYFGGMKLSPLRKAWKEMVRLANQLSNNLEYIKQ